MQKPCQGCSKDFDVAIIVWTELTLFPLSIYFPFLDFLQFTMFNLFSEFSQSLTFINMSFLKRSVSY